MARFKIILKEMAGKCILWLTQMLVRVKPALTNRSQVAEKTKFCLYQHPLSAILDEKGLDCYRTHVEKLVKTIDDSKRFVYDG